jgi:hypothetical protein
MEKSILLVAAPRYCNGGTSPYNSWPKFTSTNPFGENNLVQIMFLNCENRSSIADHLKKVITDLSRLQPPTEMSATTEFFKNVIKNIEAGQIAPIYPGLRKQAEAIMGPDSCSEQQAMYVNLNDIPVG